MKPHLPACLFHALLTACVAALSSSAPVFADVPEGYKPVTITNVNQLANYTASDYIAFIISSDITDSAYRMTGAHQYWADDVQHTHVLTFKGIENASLGGALYVSSELDAEHFQELSFSHNVSTGTYSSGGAIYASRDVSISIFGNGNVTFNGNTSSYGGAIYGSTSSIINISSNDTLVFSNNTSSSGGAIYGLGCVITLSDNNTVNFIDNTGGAICAISDGSINGAINVTNNGDVEFRNNMGVGITGHFINVTENEEVTFSKNSGNVITSDGTINITGNKELMFNGNTATRAGGIAANYGIINVTGNQNAKFIGNTASNGGIITSSDGTINITNNEYVEFRENSVTSSGGAIYGECVSLTKNETVIFKGNVAVSSGGAISAVHSESGSFTISNNNSMVFSENSASSGGAIYGHYSNIITLSNNEDIAFSKNTASSGGAIYGANGSCINLFENKNVTFSENSATTGGAIYGVKITLSGNEHVVFRGNYEIEGKDSSASIRLRSIYMYESSASLTLAAAQGQDIIFYDSIYARSKSKVFSVSYNADYEDGNGLTQKAAGDIVFSGKFAEQDLKKLKTNPTTQELTNSLTSVVSGVTNLYGGRLRIEEGAIYTGGGIQVAAESNAVLRLAHGKLNHVGYDVTLASGTMLDLQGINNITAATLDMQTDSTMSFTIGEANLTTAVLTQNGIFNQGGNLTIDIQGDETYDAEEKYMLIAMASGKTPTTWDATKITLTGIDTNVNHLTWEAGTLYYTATPPLVTAIWSGEQSRNWNFTDKNWEQEEVHYRYKDGVDVVFGDVGSGEVVLVDEVKPLSVFVENSEGHDYSFTGEGSIAGATVLTKQGEGKLTIAAANTYSGGTMMEGGTLVVGNSAALGTGGVEMNAGLLDLGGNTIANNVTTQGEVCISNGGIAGKVSMSDTVLEIARDVTIGGTITASSENLITVDAGATLSISQTIANTGSYLEIAGAVDVSNIAGTKVGESSYIGGAVQGNGFEQSNVRIQVISNAKTSRYDISEASFIYKGEEVKLDSSCAFNVGETDYTVFYVNSGTESLGTALDGAEAARMELEGVVMKHGTELTVDRNASTDLIQVKSGKATMNIAEGVTLSETNATRTDFILQGAGQYQLASGSTTLGATLGDNWKGAVQLVDVDVFEDFDLNKYGKAGSVVQMDGASVKLAPSNNVPFLPTLELTGDGMTITECYASETYIFAGGVVGDGDFVYNLTGLQHKQTYIFTGDVSQWTGAYKSVGDKTSTLRFCGDAVEMGAAIKATAGTVNVEVGNGTEAFATTFGNDITASSLKVLDKAAATLTKDATIAGGIEVAGSLKIQGEGQLNVGDSVRMGAVDGGTPATLAHVDIGSSKLSARGEDKAELSGVYITTMEDFKLENVRLEGSFIDIGEDTTFYIKNVEISADTRITDGAARMFIEGGKAFLDESNTEASAPTMSLADVTFYRSGDTETWMTLRENVSLVSLTSELFTKVMLTGTDLWLDLTGLSAQVGDATAFSVSFEDGALFDVDSLRVYATLNGEKYLDGYTTQQSGGATTLYFSQQIPEPTTGTLSLLALTALAARRKKK